MILNIGNMTQSPEEKRINCEVYFDKKGYALIWKNGKDNKVYILEFEKYIYHKKLKGYDIHHTDFNKGNYKIENLEIITKSDHLKLHANWVRKDGEWILKPCKDCKKKLPLDNFYQRKGLTLRAMGKILGGKHPQSVSNLIKKRNSKIL